jgi:DNA-binding MarR family transcriptional regulator
LLIHDHTEKNKTNAELALELAHSMLELRNFTRQFIQEKIREHGIDITFEMLEVMGILWRKDGINQQEIADKTLKDKSSMTYLLDNLIKRNLVKRAADKNDRRNNLIFLIKEGAKLKDTLNPWVTEVYGRASADVSSEDLQNGVLLVGRMVSNFKQD